MKYWLVVASHLVGQPYQTVLNMRYGIVTRIGSPVQHPLNICRKELLAIDRQPFLLQSTQREIMIRQSQYVEHQWRIH